MKIEQYISELLEHNDCVIVPHFGAFIKHYESASIHPITHKFTPPYHVIGYNGSLVLNDGLLQKHVAVGEACSDEEAMQRIMAFIHSLKQHINKFGFFEFEHIGRFFLNKEGKLQFDPEQTDHFSGDTFGLREFIVQPIDRTSYTMSSTYNKKTAAKKNEETNEEAVKKSSALKTVLIMIPIVLIVALGGIFVYMKQTDTHSIAGVNVMELFGLEEEKPVVADTTTVVEPVVETPVEPIVTEDPNAVYALIFGSFQSDQHAKKFSKKLNKKGLSTVVLEGDGYYRVGLDDVGDKTTALSKREELLAEYGDLWIMKK